jgi:aminoglycoside phosphotransferase (APT) family kinase protein
MSGLPEIPKAGDPLAIPPAVAAAYLKNVVRALKAQRTDWPEGASRVVLDECIRTLHRTAIHLTPQIMPGEQVSDEIASLQALEQRAEAELQSGADNGATAAKDGVSRDQLERYLRSRAEGGDSLTVLNTQVLPGGRSKRTTLVKVADARALPSDLVMRQDWHSAVTGTTVTSEFEVLRHVHRAGIAVPEALLLEADAERLGGPFILFRRLDGRALGDPFTPPDSEAMILDLARQVGRLHALDVEALEASVVMPRRHRGSDELRENLQTWRGLITQLGEPSKLVFAVIDWLDSQVDALDGPESLVHGDLGFHNLLCADDRVIGILDWELVHLGSPALDLGYLRSVVTQRVPWETFLSAYHEAGGPELPNRLVDFYTLYASLWLYQLLLQAKAGVSMGMVQDIEVTGVCAHFIPALLARISREYALVTGLDRKELQS